MVGRIRCIAILSFIVLVAAPAPTLAAGVEALFDLSSPSTAPFPSDRFTTSDSSHLTRLRMNLPSPDCMVRPSDCQDIHVINTRVPSAGRSTRRPSTAPPCSW